MLVGHILYLAKQLFVKYILHDKAKRVKSLKVVDLQTFLEDFVKSVNYESYPLILVQNYVAFLSEEEKLLRLHDC